MVDDEIQAQWKARFGVPAPWGSLRRSFREFHCRVINPYGSDTCPYPPGLCVAAFYQSFLDSWIARDPRVYFITVTRSIAAKRADEKPLARDRDDRLEGAVAEGGPEGRPGDLARGGGADAIPAVASDEAAYLHRRASRPTRLRDLLGPYDRGPREGRPDDGQEGAE
jgi:hypothetical protein